MTVYKFEKNALSHFLTEMMKSRDVIGPVKRKESTYDIMKSADELRLDLLLALHPPKKHFFTHEETIFEYEGDKIKETIPEVKPMVLFGLRRCDLNAIRHQDMVFIEQEPADPHYKARRDAAVLIGMHCKEGDKYCFCQSLKLPDFFDLMFFDEEPDNYLVQVGSPKGRELIDAYQEFFHKTSFIISDDMKKIKNADHLKNVNLKGEYKNPKWKDGSDICFSCGACNYLCPTCFCFELKDETNLDMKSGKRVRTPSGCQLKGFTRVAGDHYFRPERLGRFKHRIFHQMVYFKEIFGTTLCTGCGRCIRGCPVKIDWVKIANEIGEKK